MRTTTTVFALAAVVAFSISAGMQGAMAGAADAGEGAKAGDAAKAGEGGKNKDGKPKMGKICKEDVKTLCTGVEKSKGWKSRCLRANEAKLSAECAKAVAAKPAGWGRSAPAGDKK